MNTFSFRYQAPAWQRQVVQPRAVHFTLLELMLAIAVLLILMGFLFQFINSTQKIWTASEKTADIFAQAQISLQLLEKDLQTGLFSSEEDDPGHAMLMGGYIPDPDEGDAPLFPSFFFFTQDSSAGGEDSAADDEVRVGTYLVMYTWNDNVLTRYVWDGTITEHSVLPHFFYGLDPAQLDPAELEGIIYILGALQADSEKGCVLATGVSDIRIESLPDTGRIENGDFFFFDTLPKVLKITLTLYDAKAVQAVQTGHTNEEAVNPAMMEAVEQKITETERKFSKIIFLR